MAELTADQLAQANQLHGAVGWVYPETSNTAFWDNYFNSTTPTLTPDEQASGISIGPMPSSTRPNIPFGPASQQPQQPQVLPGIDSTTPDMLGAGPRQFNLTSPGGYNGTPQVVGAAGNAPINAGNVPYQSELIRSLRAANQGPASNNPGVTMLPNPQNSTLTLDFNKPVPTGLSNKPQKLQIKPVDPTPLAPDTPVGGGGGDGGGSGGGTGGGGGPIIIGPLDPVVDDDKDTDGLDKLIDDLTKDDGSDPDPWDPGNDSVDVDDKDTDGLDKLIDDLTKDDGTDPDQWDPGNNSGGDDTVPDYTDDLWGGNAGGDEGNDSINDDSVVGDDDKDTDGLDDLINDLIANNQDTAGGGDDSAGNNNIVDIFDPVDDVITDDADADAITQLYRDIFGREPDEGGLEFWDQTGLSADQIAEWFRNSDEYASLNDADGIPDYTDDLYGDDTGGNNIGNDDTGGDNTSGNDIVDTFDPVDNVNTNDADADAIAQLYRDILGREPDQGGLEFWDQTGLSADDIAEWFRGSDEYASMNADADVPDYTNDLYGDDTGVNTDVGIDLGQADDLGGLLEMYDPLDSSSPIVLDLKGEDYGTNFGSDWLIDALFGGDFSGGGGGGGLGSPMILFAQE